MQFTHYSSVLSGFPLQELAFCSKIWCLELSIFPTGWELIYAFKRNWLMRMHLNKHPKAPLPVGLTLLIAGRTDEKSRRILTAYFTNKK